MITTILIWVFGAVAIVALAVLLVAGLALHLFKSECAADSEQGY